MKKLLAALALIVASCTPAVALEGKATRDVLWGQGYEPWADPEVEFWVYPQDIELPGNRFCLSFEDSINRGLDLGFVLVEEPFNVVIGSEPAVLFVWLDPESDYSEGWVIWNSEEPIICLNSVILGPATTLH